MKPVTYTPKHLDLPKNNNGEIYKDIDTIQGTSFFDINTNWDTETQKYIIIRIAPETEVLGYLKIKNDKSTVEFKIDISKSNDSKTNYSFIIIDLLDVTLIDLTFLSTQQSLLEKVIHFLKKNGIFIVGFFIISIGLYMNRMKIINNTKKISINSSKIKL